MKKEDDEPAVSIGNRRGATTLWRMIADELRKEIAGGTLKPGERLPNEAELSTRFGVHRNTVRHALDDLNNRGIIRTEHGLGSFVRERELRYQIDSSSRLKVTAQNFYRVGERCFLKSKRQAADRRVAHDLGLQVGDTVRQIDTFNRIDGAIVSLSTSFLPLPRFNRIENYIKDVTSFTEAWKNYGINSYQRREFRVSAVALSNSESKVLGVPRRHPAIFTTNINVDEDGRTIMVTYGRVLPQFLELRFRFPPET